MAMFWTGLGWTVWALVTLITVGQWATRLTHEDGGVRILAGRCAILLTASLLVTAVTDVHKLHLLWACPVLFAGSMIVTAAMMKAKMNRFLAGARRESERSGEPLIRVLQREVTRIQLHSHASDYSEQEEAAVRSSLEAGDPEGAEARIAEVQECHRDQLRAEGIDIDSFVPEIGRDVQWSEMVRQVFRVLSLDKGKTTIGVEGVPKTESRDVPYGYLRVESPIFNQASLLPIIHRDDFLLATFVFDDPNCKQVLEAAELLVTYAPKRVLPGGRSASAAHVLHYVLCPRGTLERYYDFNNDLHMRQPAPEKLFGQFVYAGEVKVEVNQNPSI